MPVENITLVLDYEGNRLDHIVAYGYEQWGDQVQSFVVDSLESTPFDTDLEIARWLVRVLRLAHKAVLK